MKQDDSGIFAIDDEEFLNGGDDFATTPVAASASASFSAPTATSTPASAPAPTSSTSTPTIGRFSGSVESAHNLASAPFESEETTQEPPKLKLLERTEFEIKPSARIIPTTAEPEMTEVLAEAEAAALAETPESTDTPPITEVPMMQVEAHGKSENPFLKDATFRKLDIDTGENKKTSQISAFKTKGGSFTETPVEPMKPEKVRPYPGIPEHENDSYGDKTHVSYSLMPSQIMADDFIADEIDALTPAKATHHNEPADDAPSEESEPVVVSGPVISSDGIVSLSDVQVIESVQSASETEIAEPSTEQTEALAEQTPTPDVKVESEEKPTDTLAKDETVKPVATEPVATEPASTESVITESKDTGSINTIDATTEKTAETTETGVAATEVVIKKAPEEKTPGEQADEKSSIKEALNADEAKNKTKAETISTTPTADQTKITPTPKLDNQSNPSKAKSTHLLIFALIGATILVLVAVIILLLANISK